MRCRVCVSAKWTVSLGSVKSAGVDSCSPLRSGNSQWLGVEQEVHSEGFFQDVVKSQIDPVVASADICWYQTAASGPNSSSVYTKDWG